MQNIKAKIFALSPAILFLIGVTILGGTIAGGVYIFKATRNTCTGAPCDKSTAFTPFQFNEPKQLPQIEDVCGDNICGVNEELYQNVCPRDCGGVSIPPTINSFVATPNIINAGKTAVLSWSSDAIFCAPSDEGDRWRWPGGAPKGEIVTDTLSSSKLYSITCMSKDGGMSTKSVIVSVTPPPRPQLVQKIIPNDTIVSFTAVPASINLGKTTTLLWSSTNATSCSASGDGASWGWNGTRPTRGTQITPPLTSSQTYEIKCTGKNGSLSKKMTVAVSSSATAPSVSLSALPNIVPYGEKATLAWIISDAESCTTSNSGGYPEWSGALPSKSLFGGLKITRPLTGEETYTITCVNGAGTATATTMKSVNILVEDAVGCTSPSGEEVPSGSSIEAFQAGTVAYGETCVSQKRNCLNGKLSGSYTNQSCTVGKGKDCSLGGTTVKSGGIITAYKDATVPLGSGTSCSPETRQCENGTLTGSYTNQSCDVVYYNTNLLGANGSLQCGGGAGDYLNRSTNPDCTCRTDRLQSSNICTFNSWAHGGNNHYECFYSCTLPPQKATSIQIANCTLNTDGTITCTP